MTNWRAERKALKRVHPPAPCASTPSSHADQSVLPQGDEVTFLPPIVDAAESSPAAAAECARLIRKYLSKDYWSKPSYQYNSIMLIRILSDNPGMTFTRNMDKKFVDTAKELLRTGRDPSVRQMLMETLDTFETTKSYDEGLGPIIEMWKKEKQKAHKAYGVRYLDPQPRAPRVPRRSGRRGRSSLAKEKESADQPHRYLLLPSRGP